MGVAGKHFPPHVKTNPTAQRDNPAPSLPDADERVRKESWFGHLLNRPEFAAISGAVLVFLVFAIGAGSSGMFNLDGVMNWSQVSAYLGILAVGACLLMIAGEFDLSIGSMIGFAGMMVAIPVGLFSLADLACDSVRVRRLDAARRAERLSRDEHAPAVVHRHAGVPVHPARPHARAVDHVRRPHHRLRRRRPRATGLVREYAVPRRRVSRPVPDARASRHRHLARQRPCRSCRASRR